MPEWLQRHLPEGWTATHLLWLGIIGIVLFIGTIVFGAIRRAASKRKL